ncbi:MAG: class I tRNA ligase family protein [Candidatus Acidiferrales bacterium]
MSKPKYYLTTPIYDAASSPQIECVYTAVLCDAIARHKRICGFDVAQFIGADTHGVNFERPEERIGAARAALLRRNEKKFEELLNLVDVHSTHFQRTCSAEHIRGVETLIRRTLRRSRLAIYKARHQGRYCVHDEIDVSDSAEPADCAICGRAAVLISEERYFFRLSAFQDRLLALYKYRPEFIQPRFRLNEIRNLVTRGLKDIPIGRRTTERGIPWPDDSYFIVLGRYAKLASYLSGLGLGEAGYGSDEFKRLWPANLHVTGKEAFHSHTIYWPAFLMAADLNVPRHVFTHGAVCFEQEGMDKALFSEPIGQILGSDALRYYLLRQVGYGENARLGCEGLVRYCNDDLAEGLERLASRTLTLIARHCHGRIPVRSLLSSIDSTIEIAAGDIQAEVRFLLDSFNFCEALRKIWSLVAMIDKLLADNAQYELTGDPSEKRRFTDVLHDACQGLALIALLLHPILPRATDAIWNGLGQATRLEDQLIDETPWSCLMPGTPIGKLEPLFSGVDTLQNMTSMRPETSLRR